MSIIWNRRSWRRDEKNKTWNRGKNQYEYHYFTSFVLVIKKLNFQDIEVIFFNKRRLKNTSKATISGSKELTNFVLRPKSIFLPYLLFFICFGHGKAFIKVQKKKKNNCSSGMCFVFSCSRKYRRHPVKQ